MGIRVSKNSIERDFAMERPCKRTKSDHDSSLDTNTKTMDHIPMDIVKEILQRLPVKSIAKFMTVSKSWSTIIRSNYFITSFSLQQSMASQEGSHRLLFVRDEILEGNWGYFSLWSLNLATEKPPLKFISRMVLEFDRLMGFDLPIYVKGLLCFVYRKTQVICNPSTGKFIFLPDVKTRRKILTRYFGFDPIKAEYKVLCIIDSMCSRDGRITPSQNQILTLGSKNLWRKLDFWIRHKHIDEGICIDGIIYYLAYEYVSFPNIILVRFDVKSEKFLKQLPCLFLQHLPYGVSLTLINYGSKLAIEYQTNYYPIDLWVLEDSEKVEWLKISLDVSPWASSISRYDIKIMGTTTPNGEIVYVCNRSKDGFYVIYHDHKKNQHRRIEIKPPNLGSVGSFIPRICFNDYVESVMLL